ncbi:hypothetical protein LR48_Vigan205s007600 [Vigna angularis]|uniref:Uncharacterized protein n=1 Tax=Phaseolus angularis TaxID=3914 RepID=A0A0L9T775_PHAAN|nr:hypothetical protein LR48_Vigan205s007600 [Vigna angularis]
MEKKEVHSGGCSRNQTENEDGMLRNGDNSGRMRRERGPTMRKKKPIGAYSNGCSRGYEQRENAPARRPAASRLDSDVRKAAREKHLSENYRKEEARDGAGGRDGDVGTSVVHASSKVEVTGPAMKHIMKHTANHVQQLGEIRKSTEGEQQHFTAAAGTREWVTAMTVARREQPPTARRNGVAAAFNLHADRRTAAWSGSGVKQVKEQGAERHPASRGEERGIKNNTPAVKEKVRIRVRKLRRDDRVGRRSRRRSRSAIHRTKLRWSPAADDRRRRTETGGISGGARRSKQRQWLSWVLRRRDYRSLRFNEKVQYYDVATDKRAEFDRAMAEYNKKIESGEFDETDEESEFDE